MTYEQLALVIMNQMTPEQQQMDVTLKYSTDYEEDSSEYYCVEGIDAYHHGDVLEFGQPYLTVDDGQG